MILPTPIISLASLISFMAIKNGASIFLHKIKRIPASMLMLLVKFYQLFISPMFGPRCRFYPTCSEYAIEALKTHGALKGSWLTINRLRRCHPLNPGGHDPVPPCCKHKEEER